MADDTAGDPVTGAKWTRRTTEKVADELRRHGIDVCPNTVAKLLKQLDYSLRVNHKKLARTSDPGRDEQFAYIATMREQFTAAGLPIVSIDTKHRELVGNFAHKGTTWRRQPRLVNDHDFPSDALGVAIPYGVYDLHHNRGCVTIGTSRDTAEFAVASLTRWWNNDGRHRWPDTQELLVLADGGGSNSHRSRRWKHALQHKLCNRHDLTVTVCHYPTGASKWNPIVTSSSGTTVVDVQHEALSGSNRRRGRGYLLHRPERRRCGGARARAAGVVICGGSGVVDRSR